MYSRIGALVLVAAWAGFGQEIHLKTRTIQPDSTAVSTTQPADLPGVHRIVQFDHFPSVEDLDTLLADGNVVVSVVPDNAVVVTAQTGSVMVRPGMNWIAPLNPADKLSPALANAAAISAIVEFHADVPQSAQEAVFAAEGMTSLRPTVLMANHAIVMASPGGLTALAAHDEVAYIFPADPGLLNGGDLYPCIGMLTTAGPVAQYSNIVHGWDLDSANAAHLGYVFGALTPNVPAATVRSEILRALNEWSKYTNVIFKAGTSAAASRTVFIEFASGAHGDAYPFEGSTGVIAHTFYPVPVNPESIAGDMHLNADVPWHVGSDMDIYSVALHEAGHAIGLGHSDNPGDVMYPYYRTNMALSANDIGAAQALYGVPGAATVISAAPVAGAAGTGGTAAALPSPLQLTLNAVPSSTTASETSLKGTVSGGTPPVTVQWQTNHGYSGAASIVNAAWTAGAVTLVNGSNTVSVTAFDAAHDTASQSATITLTPPPPVTVSSVPVTVAITSPSSVEVTVGTATISLAGTASGGAGVTRVTWETCGGATGTATGTGRWTASAIPLLEGTNTIMVRAYDATGANGWTAQIAVRH